MTKTIATMAAAAVLWTGIAGAGEIRATVQGVRPGGGPVMAALFDSADSFAAGRRLAGQSLPPLAATVTATFHGLPPGRYLLAVYQDANGNEKLDANLFGVPLEAYGFGGDPPAAFGPPAFDAAAVALTGTEAGATLAVTATLTP